MGRVRSSANKVIICFNIPIGKHLFPMFRKTEPCPFHELIVVLFLLYFHSHCLILAHVSNQKAVKVYIFYTETLST